MIEMCQCGKEMVLAPAIGYYCPDSNCPAQYNEMMSSIRKTKQEREALRNEIEYLCSPAAEAMPDGLRLTSLINATRKWMKDDF